MQKPVEWINSSCAGGASRRQSLRDLLGLALQDARWFRFPVEVDGAGGDVLGPQVSGGPRWDGGRAGVGAVVLLAVGVGLFDADQHHPDHVGPDLAQDLDHFGQLALGGLAGPGGQQDRIDVAAEGVGVGDGQQRGSVHDHDVGLGLDALQGAEEPGGPDEGGRAGRHGAGGHDQQVLQPRLLDRVRHRPHLRPVQRHVGQAGALGHLVEVVDVGSAEVDVDQHGSVADRAHGQRQVRRRGGLALGWAR